MDTLAETNTRLARQIEGLHRAANIEEIEIGGLQQNIGRCHADLRLVPPMMPASAIGPASSAMTNISEVSLRFIAVQCFEGFASGGGRTVMVGA